MAVDFNFLQNYTLFLYILLKIKSVITVWVDKIKEKWIYVVKKKCHSFEIVEYMYCIPLKRISSEIVKNTEEKGKKKNEVLKFSIID